MSDLEDARAKMLKLREQASQGTRWRHLKSGKDYMVHGFALIEATLEPAVLYTRYGETETWCRPADEFLDGRFVEITEAVS